GDHEAITLGREPRQRLETHHPANPGQPAPLRPSTYARDAHPQRDTAPRDRSTDPAQAEDAEPQLGEFTERDRERRELRSRPLLRGLKGAHPVQAAGEIG